MANPTTTMRFESRKPPISDRQCIELADETIKAAKREEEKKGTANEALRGGLKPGLTIDLCHKNIERIPDEVVDLMADEIERYVDDCCRIMCQSKFPLYCCSVVVYIYQTKQSSGT
jgi:hypothetical protein